MTTVVALSQGSVRQILRMTFAVAAVGSLLVPEPFAFGQAPWRRFLSHFRCQNSLWISPMGVDCSIARGRQLRRTAEYSRKRHLNEGLPGRCASLSGRLNARQARMETSAVCRIRRGVRPRARHDGSSHGRGLDKVFLHGGMGIRPIHRRQAGGRSAAPDLLRLPRGKCQRP
jgi:hypothetical protein